MQKTLERLGLSKDNAGGFCGEWLSRGEESIASVNPTTEEGIARASFVSSADYDAIVNEARSVFQSFREIPAPVRGQIVRQIGESLRVHKKDLATLITLETGKILAEAEGEVQEMIDVADFAVGLSRQLYGLAMHSERPNHRMFEQWHPLGPIGVISAFNFPAAVWSWNALIAAVCGDTVVWKPSEKTPLTAIAITKIAADVCKSMDVNSPFFLAIGGLEIGERMANDRRLPLISATGSTRMGLAVADAVAKRLGRSLLELGGNNAVIVMDDADLDIALPAVLFGAVGTAGQRCTSTRRLFLQRGIRDKFLERLAKAYQSVKIGDPLESSTLMGPLIDEQAVRGMQGALERAKSEGGSVMTGGARLDRKGFFVTPSIVQAKRAMPIVAVETFAPILYAIEFGVIDDAIAMQNDVKHGLSSAIFTRDVRASERFLSAAGSDCGIANVNLGTSGAEVGGAFGGEKETGGGRESGSDSWKAYMRRQTVTVNYGSALPLAQGIKFGD